MKKVFRILLYVFGWALFLFIAFFILSQGYLEYNDQKGYYDESKKETVKETVPEAKEIKEVNKKALELRDAEKWKEFAELSEAHYKNPDFNFRFAYATAFVNGKEFPKDYRRAVEILSFDVPKNWSYHKSLVQLANLYNLGGEGLEKDSAKSNECFDKFFANVKLEEENSIIYNKDDHSISISTVIYDAFYIYVGHEYCTYPADGFPVNKVLGVKIMQKAIELTPLVDLNALAVIENIYKKEGRQNDYFKLQGELFDKGNFDVGLDYAYALLFGKHKDEARGFIVMKKTADFVNSGGKNTNAEPWYNTYVAVMYKNGIGTEKNIQETQKYFDKAKTYYERNAKSEGSSYTMAVEDAVQTAALIYFGKNSRGKQRLHDQDLGLELINFADTLTEKYAPKKGNKELIEFYKCAKMEDKLDELYKRYAARIPKYKGEYERYLKAKEESDKK